MSDLAAHVGGEVVAPEVAEKPASCMAPASLQNGSKHHLLRVNFRFLVPGKDELFSTWQAYAETFSESIEDNEST